MSAIFDYLSFARAKKNTEDLAKTNPQNPVLKQDDEQFLHRVASQDVPAAPLPPSIIKDDGTEKAADSQRLKEAGEAAGSVALPAVSETENTDLSQAPDAIADDGKETSESQKRTWGSYVPSVPSIPSMPSLPTWRSKAAEKAPDAVKDKIAPKDESGAPVVSTTATPDDKGKAPAIGDDAKAADAYPPGVKITEDVKLDQAKLDQDEKEVSVILDRLNLSSINNRVFSFSDKSQQLYQDFTVILKDMINGAPTAYHDMEKLLRDNEAHLSEMFNNMPPFVQTLVKSLPAKMGTTLGPEILAAASEKPGADMKARMSAASKSPTASKNKKKVPSVKGLANQKGAIASMLRSIVTFLQTRFPVILTGTNVIMSLAVFILLFVFWYCHKRGRETRLLKEADAASLNDASDAESGLDESQILTPESSTAGLEKESGGLPDLDDADGKAAEEILNRSEPAEVPLKEDEKALHGAKASAP
ncbi:hypothetical protein KVT40_005611 [Elsinoe batatas]|uniref:Uncharacterized protein n=1 Tax=Elsinoe batatas TaxID=2601811 RepID=A0A8K0KYU3_9PEZI|nr:hypothetical protein KVT40_005611 [Elsinoe batatas]